MKTYILMHCAAVLATISLVLSYAGYFSDKPVKDHPKHLVEYPVVHSTYPINPTLAVPKIPLKAAYVATPTDMKTGDCKQ